MGDKNLVETSEMSLERKTCSNFENQHLLVKFSLFVDHSVLGGLATEVHGRLVTALGKDVLRESTVCKRCKRFKKGN